MMYFCNQISKSANYTKNVCDSHTGIYLIGDSKGEEDHINKITYCTFESNSDVNGQNMRFVNLNYDIAKLIYT